MTLRMWAEAPALAQTELRSDVAKTLPPDGPNEFPESDVAPGRFELLERLGQGAMGEVHLVRDHDMKRSIAVKRLNESSADLVQRFLAEIRTVAQLEHPNIVPVHDIGVDEQGRPYFLMKHVKGQTLERLIQQLQSGEQAFHLRWSFVARARLFLGILNAVAYAHERGVLHRDLKPANIMVGEFGEVTVMDWGIARSIAPVERGQGSSHETPVNQGVSWPLESDLQLVGSPLYMSPEQARRENSRLDQRSDVYSLGVVLHELLFLHHYLDGRSDLGAVLDGVQHVHPALHDHRASPGQSVVSAELAWFVDRAMQKDPAHRFQSVHEMRDELERVLAGRFKVQCTRTAFRRLLSQVMQWSDRSPKVVTLGGGALALVGLLGLMHLVAQAF